MSIASSFNKFLGESCFTLLGSTSVWVSSFELKSIVLSILESIYFETSVTSRRFGVAINELLLRELKKLSSGNEMSTLHSGS
jgi:hypothetical protein